MEALLWPSVLILLFFWGYIELKFYFSIILKLPQKNVLQMQEDEVENILKQIATEANAETGNEDEEF